MGIHLIKRTAVLAGLLAAGLYAQADSPEVEYYRDETAFKQGLELFPFEIYEDDFLKVVYNDLGFVSEFRWYTRADHLLRIRTYEYWDDDHSVKRMLEQTADSLILRELLFGDEPRSREFIKYLVGGEVVADFRDRFTEVIYDSLQTPVTYKIMSTQGQLIGAIFLDYDSLGYLVHETWFQGRPMERIREFRYIFHRDTGEVELIERGREGQVVSHVRLQDPHRVTGDKLGLGADLLEAPPDTLAPADSLERANEGFR